MRRLAYAALAALPALLALAWAATRNTEPPVTPTPAGCTFDVRRPPEAGALACWRAGLAQGYTVCPDAHAHPAWLAAARQEPRCDWVWVYHTAAPSIDP